MRLHVWLFAAAVVLLATTLVQGGNYNYCEALRLTLLFYQAQRSGYLSNMAPEVWWRWDSAVNDRGQNGENLEGGYYDAGDHVKFGFPFAYSMTVLAWSLISYRDGFQKCNLLNEGRNTVLWGMWYLRKAHIRPDRLYGQVGLGQLDHDYWGRAECMTMSRPAFYIDPSKPGSDLAAESAAAFASASIVFKGVDNALSAEMLERAKELYNLADKHRGKYSDSITDAANFYGSWSYEDELAWGAAWLAYATNDQYYLNLAKNYYSQFGLQWSGGGLGWDQKSSGVEVLLAQLTSDSQYKNQLRSYCDHMKNTQQRTPKGLVYLGKWGSLRNNANAMYICLEAARLGINTNEYRTFAKQQIDYSLGDSGRSFLVGWGSNYPRKAHHRGSSCPADPCSANTCNWNTFAGSQPNPNILYGALVGGPDENDNYEDRRDDAVQNEVALDYNAAYVGDLAALALLF